MKVLFLSAEVSPFAKVGGLADIAGALPLALCSMGHDVRVMMPAYRMVLDDPRWRIDAGGHEFPVHVNSRWTQSAWLHETTNGTVPTYLVNTDAWWGDAVSSERIYAPGVEQYLFFATAVLEACRQLDWIPDVVHCNDWHMGMVPVLMRERFEQEWQNVASVFTIHNFAYQGEFGPEILDMLDLPHYLYRPDRLETFGRVNFLKSGCVYSDQVNTVSPTYAQEIQTPEYGLSLFGLMQWMAREGRLSGILNGIDDRFFNPAHDKHLPANYTLRDLKGKQVCREHVREELGFDDVPEAPLFGMVSRLSNQKGMDLVVAAASRIVRLPALLVVQGLGDPWIAGEFRKLERRYKGRVRLVERFDEPLAQRIYAGSDGFLMPSAFEPCGLGQMIAMRYGTVPVVRQVGGLADTVQEGVNGFTFHDRTEAALMGAVARAWSAFGNRTTWNRLLRNGMSGDYGWDVSAVKYVGMYEEAVASRRPESVRTAV